jgi:prepilin-type N-terminal cleavage/methylation domain-containing protein
MEDYYQMSNEKKKRNQRGISLIEVIVSVAIIALGVTALMAQLEASYKITSVNRETNKATAHLQAAMEKVIATPFNNIVNTHPNESVVYLDNINTEDLMTGEYITVTYADENADPLEITVTVYWTSFDGRARSRSLTTMRTR